MPGVPFVKGDPRCWRGGRPKKGKAFPDILRAALEECKDGKPSALQSIIANMISIAKSKRSNAVAATIWLTENAYGKAPLQLLISPAIQSYNLDKLPAEKLNLLEEVVGQLEKDNDVIDGVAVSVDDQSGTG